MGGLPCDDKVRYLTRDQAKAMLRSARRSAEGKRSKGRHTRTLGMKNTKRQEQRTYECPHCNFWHLTSQSKEEYESRVSRYQDSPRPSYSSKWV